MKNKVLLIKLSSLGDVIFNIPLASALKDAGYDVSWLVSEKGYNILKNNPCVDKVILAPLQKWKKRGFSFENFKEYISILNTIRSEKFDIAIDAQMMFKSLFWFAFCGAKRRITSKKAGEFSFLGANEWVDGISYHPKGHIVLNYLKYAEYLNIEVDPQNIEIGLPPRTKEQTEKIDSLLEAIDLNKQIVTIAPATTWDNKHWDKEHWKEVVNYLLPKCNLIFTGGINDSELINYISEGQGINLSGKTDVLELAEVFSRSDLVISPDSGSAHLAWASVKPKVITIFTCTPKNILGPIGNSDKYVSIGGCDLSCQPCFKKKCKLKDNKNACTKTLKPEDVINTINNMLFNIN